MLHFIGGIPIVGIFAYGALLAIIPTTAALGFGAMVGARIAGMIAAVALGLHRG